MRLLKYILSFISAYSQIYRKVNHTLVQHNISDNECKK